MATRVTLEKNRLSEPNLGADCLLKLLVTAIGILGINSPFSLRIYGAALLEQEV